MRVLFLLLLLANLAFFAWAQYWGHPDSGSDQRPFGRQFAPQKLPIVAPPSKPRPAGNAAAPAKVSSSCVEWGSFALADVAAAMKLLQPLALGGLLTEHKVQETAKVGSHVTEVPKVWLRIRGVGPGLRARLQEIAKAVEGSDLRGCS